MTQAAKERPFCVSDLRLLESLGFHFALDPDGRLEIIPTRDADEMAAALCEHAEAIANVLRYRERLARSQCVGGPRDGEQHYAEPGDVLAFHIARRWWALYLVREDGRAIHQGHATSLPSAHTAAVRLQIHSGMAVGRFHRMEK